MSRVLSVFACVMMLSGCPAGAGVDVVTVLTHGNCGRSIDGVEIVDFTEVANLRPSTRLIGMEQSPTSAQEGVLLIAIGQGTRPTPGYGLAVAKPGALLDGTLTVFVAEKMPPEDAVMAQMLTQPCLVVGVPEAGVRNVVAKTADGTLIGETAITAR